jgi:hypothetical protein
VIAYLLDDSSVLALGKGYRALSGLIVDAAAGRAMLAVPALCLCSAEAQRPGIAEHLAMLPVDIEPLELSAVIPAGRLIGDGVDWRIAQAVAAALPSPVHPDGRVVLSADTARYRGTGIEPVDPRVVS